MLPAAAGAGVGLLLLLPRGAGLALLSAFLLVPLAQLVLTPLWRRAGVYRYHSPMLFAVRRASSYELHGGTGVDLLHNFRRLGALPGRRRALLRLYLEGLLDVARAARTGVIPGDAQIVASSYFFNARTAAKLGFSLQPARLGERLHLVLDIVSLTLMHSLVNSGVGVPRVWSVRRATIRATELARRTESIEALLGRVRPREEHAARRGTGAPAALPATR